MGLKGTKTRMLCLTHASPLMASNYTLIQQQSAAATDCSGSSGQGVDRTAQAGGNCDQPGALYTPCQPGGCLFPSRLSSTACLDASTYMLSRLASPCLPACLPVCLPPTVLLPGPQRTSAGPALLLVPHSCCHLQHYTMDQLEHSECNGGVLAHLPCCLVLPISLPARLHLLASGSSRCLLYPLLTCSH